MRQNGSSPSTSDRIYSNRALGGAILLFMVLTAAWTTDKPKREAFVRLPIESVTLIKTIYEKDGMLYQRKCRGILTSDQKVLTAKHCIPDKSFGNIKYTKVSFIDAHSQPYDYRNAVRLRVISRDMMVLYLDRPAPSPIPRVPLTRIEHRNRFFAAPVIRPQGENSYHFRELVGVLRSQIGESADEFTLAIVNKGSYRNRAPSICLGDSGSPVFVHDRSKGEYRLAGVVSFVSAPPGKKCSDDYFTIETSLSPLI